MNTFIIGPFYDWWNIPFIHTQK